MAKILKKENSFLENNQKNSFKKIYKKYQCF